MSRIERVTATRVSTPLHTPLVTALRRTTTTGLGIDGLAA